MGERKGGERDHMIPKNHPDEYGEAPPMIITNPLIDPERAMAGQAIVEKVRHEGKQPKKTKKI